MNRVYLLVFLNSLLIAIPALAGSNDPNEFEQTAEMSSKSFGADGVAPRRVLLFRCKSHFSPLNWIRNRERKYTWDYDGVGYIGRRFNNAESNGYCLSMNGFSGKCLSAVDENGAPMDCSVDTEGVVIRGE